MSNNYYEYGNLPFYDGELLTYIEREDLKSSIGVIQGAVQKIWSGEIKIIKEYTGHGFDHSIRIVKKLEQLLTQKGKNGEPKAKILTQEEMYLLIIGVLLHDIGMQCDVKKFRMMLDKVYEDYKQFNPGEEIKLNIVFDSDPYTQYAVASKYTWEEQQELRKYHNYFTAAMLDYGFENKDYFLHDALSGIDESLREDLVNICRYHSKLDIESCPEVSMQSGIRLRLVAALVRFGDELDIDSKRVVASTPVIFGMEWMNPRFWFVHSHTAVEIKGDMLTVKVNLHPDDMHRIKDVIKKEYIDAFFEKNALLMQILSENGITIIKNTRNSQVYQGKYLSKIEDQYVDTVVQWNLSQKDLRNNLNSPNLETPFIYKSRLNGQLIASVLKGNNIRIVVWNLSDAPEKQQTPVAVLDGIEEEVSELHFFKGKTSILLAGMGKNTVYVWHLNNPIGETKPHWICRDARIGKVLSGYGISIDQEEEEGNNSVRKIYICVIASAENKIYTWKPTESMCETAIEQEVPENAVLILDSELSEKRYQIIRPFPAEGNRDSGVVMSLLQLNKENGEYEIKQRFTTPEKNILASTEPGSDLTVGFLTNSNIVLLKDFSPYIEFQHMEQDSLNLKCMAIGNQLYAIEYVCRESKYHPVENSIIAHRVADNAEASKIWEGVGNIAITGIVLCTENEVPEIYYGNKDDSCIYRLKWNGESRERFYSLETETDLKKNPVKKIWGEMGN